MKVVGNGTPLNTLRLSNFKSRVASYPYKETTINYKVQHHPSKNLSNWLRHLGGSTQYFSSDTFLL